MRYWIATSLLILGALACPAAESKSSEFVLTTTARSSEHRVELSLIGEFPPLKEVHLLSNIDATTCRAVTLKAVDYKEYPYDESNILRLTPIDTRDCRAPFSQYALAYLGTKVHEYHPLAMIRETRQSTIRYIHKIVRERNLLKAWEEYPNPPGCLSKHPVLYHPIPEQKKTYMVQYILKRGDHLKGKYGPLFFFSNGKPVELDNEAVITKAFSLNGRHFVLYDHGCWAGCGNIYTALVEIKADQFITVFRDGTWAD